MQKHAKVKLYTAFKYQKNKINKSCFCSLTGSGMFSVCRSGISLVDVHGTEKTPTHRARKSFNENSYNLFGCY